MENYTEQIQKVSISLTILASLQNGGAEWEKYCKSFEITEDRLCQLQCLINIVNQTIRMHLHTIVWTWEYYKAVWSTTNLLEYI